LHVLHQNGSNGGTNRCNANNNAFANLDVDGGFVLFNGNESGPHIGAVPTDIVLNNKFETRIGKDMGLDSTLRNNINLGSGGFVDITVASDSTPSGGVFGAEFPGSGQPVG